MSIKLEKKWGNFLIFFVRKNKNDETFWRPFFAKIMSIKPLYNLRNYGLWETLRNTQKVSFFQILAKKLWCQFF